MITHSEKGIEKMRISYIEDMKMWEKEFTYSYPFIVRFSETDMFGHLNNTVPFTYFETARINYFKHIGWMSDWMNAKTETIPVVADLQCDFLKQVFLDEHIDVYVKAGKVGNSSIDLHYMGKNQHGQIVFTGRGTIVQISRHTGKAIPFDEENLRIMKKPQAIV